MESQDKLFHDDVNDAIHTLILALGGYKKVASDLWPHKAQNSAYARLKACVQDDKDERLSPQELIYLIKQGRAVNCHVALYYICDDANYQRPKPVEPEEELADLQRQLSATAAVLADLMAKFERTTESLSDMRRKPRAVGG